MKSWLELVRAANDEGRGQSQKHPDLSPKLQVVPLHTGMDPARSF